MWLVWGMLLGMLPAAAWAQVTVVAAENFYGEAARSLGGADVTVTSILSNPDQDPHLFEASPSVARSLAAARIVVVNGVGYDPWMGTLLAAHDAPGRAVIDVASLVGRKPGDNPHLWYDPATMPAFARAFAAALDRADPTHGPEHATRLAGFLHELAPLDAEIGRMRSRYAGEKVAASEPVFGYMAAALGLDMQDERFQLAVMNDTEPSASDVARFEADLMQHRVRAMLYNSQAEDAAVKRLVGIARRARVPVVGVTETQPAGTTYVGWMLGQLQALDRALR